MVFRIGSATSAAQIKIAFNIGSAALVGVLRNFFHIGSAGHVALLAPGGVSLGKTHWKTRHVISKGFFWGKHKKVFRKKNLFNE